MLMLYILYMNDSWQQRTVINYYSLCCADDIPAMTDLINLKGKTRSIDITMEIGVKWRDVGTALLNDTTGTIMPALNQTYSGNVSRVNFEVLR